jgi:rRNA-processing protein FCF1
MKILMDADCLIKLTKAGLKEFICRHEKIAIPGIVKREVVDAGKAKGYPDADLVEKNIQDGLIALAKEATLNHVGGDQALIVTFKQGRYVAVATDDAKLTRVLRAAGIPFILPALPKRCIKMSARITPTLPSPLRGGGLGWGGKGHRR